MTESEESAIKIITEVIPTYWFSGKRPPLPLKWYGMCVVLTRYFKPVVEKANEEALKEIIRATQCLLKDEVEVNKFYNWIKGKPTNEKMRILLMQWGYS